MSKTRKPASESSTYQEILFQRINETISTCSQEGIIPAPALFINAKYAEAHGILNKLLKILPLANVAIEEEKAKHHQEWVDTFKSHDLEIQELAEKQRNAAKLVENMKEEFRLKKIELEETKKKLREEKERLSNDEQRHATLTAKKRADNLGNLEAQKIELDKKEETLVNNAGCCGLSKKKKKERDALKLAASKVDDEIKKVTEMKDNDITVFDEEYNKLKNDYKKADENLKEYVESFTKKIQIEKDNLDAIEVSFNQKENDLQLIQNRFDSYLSNSLMFRVLQVYVCYNDFYEAVKRIESTKPALASLKESMAINQQDIEKSVSMLWCPDSKDRGSDVFLSNINKDPALKKIVIDSEKLSDDLIQKVIPQAQGHILNRLKKGDLTGVSVRPNDIISFPEVVEAMNKTRSLKIK